MNIPPQQLKSEASRLDSFCEWPVASPVDPRRLARSGFYRIGPGDRVRCIFCNGILKCWMNNDNPDTEHRKHFPNCPFMLGQQVGNIPIVESNIPTRPLSLDSKSGGSLENMRYPNMADVNARMKSMNEYPPNVNQDREVLVNAGFFYMGHGDSVRCFACGGSLRNWQNDDDPWIEHARWFPRCPFVRQQKGDDFVNDIVANFRNASELMSPQTESPRPRRKHQEVSPMIQAVVSMGYNQDEVQRVLLDLKRMKGPVSNISSEELMAAVLDDQERKNSPTTSLTGASGSGQESNDRIICKICMEREVEVTFLPCGHLVCCEPCSRHVKECPVCRKRIRGSVRTFLA